MENLLCLFVERLFVELFVVSISGFFFQALPSSFFSLIFAADFGLRFFFCTPLSFLSCSDFLSVPAWRSVPDFSFPAVNSPAQICFFGSLV
jgi:hypothetical protein